MAAVKSAYPCNISNKKDELNSGGVSDIYWIDANQIGKFIKVWEKYLVAGILTLEKIESD